MKFYSIQIPPLAPATFYKLDGVWRHTQDSEKPRLLTCQYYDSHEKIIKIDDSIHFYDEVHLTPLFRCRCHDVCEFVEQQIKLLENNCLECYSTEELKQYNVFIGHTSFDYRDVYLSFSALKGIGCELWENMIQKHIHHSLGYQHEDK